MFLHAIFAACFLFTTQLEYHLAGLCNLIARDALAHNDSRPYELEAVSVLRVAAKLAAILDAESVDSPILIGQFFDGIVDQRLMQLSPSLNSGFLNDSSAANRRDFWLAVALFELPRTGPLLRLRSIKGVLENAPEGTS